ISFLQIFTSLFLGLNLRKQPKSKRGIIHRETSRPSLFPFIILVRFVLKESNIQCKKAAAGALRTLADNQITFLV
ncbi:hypothetical protein M8C21_030563, partial [Ambrosia artemisiifolia]